MSAVVGQESLGVSREFEEVVLLRGPVDGMAALIPAVSHLSLRHEDFFVLAVPPGMLAEVDVVGVVLLDAADHLQHSDPMPRLGGPDEIVVTDIQLLPQWD